MIFLEDDDVAAVTDGRLTIHRIKRNFDDPNESSVREVVTLKMEIQQIMKGAWKANNKLLWNMQQSFIGGPWADAQI